MRIIIAGSRSFDNYKILKEKCSEIIGGKDVEIVCGMARGADTLGEKCGYDIKYFPAKWSLFGKSAGYKRNEQMAKYADMLIAFWDGKSRGTGHMIDLARKYNLIIHVFYHYIIKGIII